MPNILLSSTSSDASSALSQCDLSNSTLFDRSCKPASQVQAYSPYLIGDEPSLLDQAIVGKLIAGDASRKLTDMAQCFGAEHVSELAEFREHAAALGVGAIGTSSSVYTDRTNKLVKALEKYERSLLAYRDTAKSGSPLQVSKRFEARRAFDQLQTQFQAEMRAITAKTKSRRGTPLTHAERGVNIARSSRHANKLYVANQAQAHSLVKFARGTKILGNGLAAIDFGSSIGEIHTSYLAGANWHREMFVQSTKFTFGVLSASAAVKGGLVLMAMFTPVGLVGLIVGGLAIAAGGAVAGYAASEWTEARAGDWYDAIMEWLT